jgi:transposase InsO family protein
VLIDLFNRQVVGWSASSRLTRQLTIDALQMALDHRSPAPGLMHHSDRGSQYAAGDYQNLLAKHKMTCSMSRKGNCYDDGAPRTLRPYRRSGAAQEMRVWPLGIGLQDRVPNHVKLL